MKTKLTLLLAFLVPHFCTVAWAVEVVIPDAALKAVIWESLGKPEPVGILTEQDMLSLTNLQAYGLGMKSAEGLAAAHNLATLDLGFNHLSEFSFLNGLPNLTTLDLAFNQLTNLVLPAGLTNLSTLNLAGNQLTNLTLSPGLTSLVTLDLSFSTASEFALSGDVSYLASFRAAGQRDLVPIFGPLANLILPSGLTNLTTLDLFASQLANLTLPDDLTSLTTLNLCNNRLTSWTLPAGLTNLTALCLLGSRYPGENPLQSLVLPEPLAKGALADLVADLRNQGVSVSIYLPGLRLVAMPRAMGGAFELLLTGPPGTYRLQATRDFSTWTDLDPVTLDANGSVRVTHPSANAGPHSFYRALLSN